jgi:hypothetical protein
MKKPNEPMIYQVEKGANMFPKIEEVLRPKTPTREEFLSKIISIFEKQVEDEIYDLSNKMMHEEKCVIRWRSAKKDLINGMCGDFYEKLMDSLEKMTEIYSLEDKNDIS